MAGIPEHFSATVAANGGGTVMTLAGELDMSGHVRAGAQASTSSSPRRRRRRDVRPARADLRRLDRPRRADRRHQRLEDAGVRSRFLRGSDDIQRVFTIAGFDGVLVRGPAAR